MIGIVFWGSGSASIVLVGAFLRCGYVDCGRVGREVDKRIGCAGVGVKGGW